MNSCVLVDHWSEHSAWAAWHRQSLYGVLRTPYKLALEAGHILTEL